MNGKRVMKTKKPVALVALLLLLCCTVAGTLAYLVDKTPEVKNTFEPAKVTTSVLEDPFDGVTKKNVRIKNTGNIDAYIRATVVVNWASDKEVGVVSGTAPKEGTDYTIEWTMSNWIKVGDYYYYTQKVAANGATEQLFTNCKLLDGANVPDGYHLQVTILADGIQAEPVHVVADVWKDVRVDGGKLVDATATKN